MSRQGRILIFSLIGSALLHGSMWFFLKPAAEPVGITLVRIEPVASSLTDAGEKPKHQKSTDGATKNSPSAESQTSAGDSALISGASVGLKVSYPRLSRLTGEQGRVVIEITSDHGTRIRQSSGFERLDQSALTATRLGLEQGLLNELLSKQPLASLEFVFRLTE